MNQRLLDLTEAACEEPHGRLWFGSTQPDDVLADPNVLILPFICKICSVSAAQPSDSQLAPSHPLSLSVGGLQPC